MEQPEPKQSGGHSRAPRPQQSTLPLACHSARLRCQRVKRSSAQCAVRGARTTSRQEYRTAVATIHGTRVMNPARILQCSGQIAGNPNPSFKRTLTCR
eukprot:scaffold1163_cov362-Prasinococcus_capsulatus_cf.AAC.14